MSEAVIPHPLALEAVMRELARLQAKNKELLERERLRGPVEPPPGGPHDPGMEARVARLETVLPRIETRIERVETGIEGLDTRLRAVEQSVAAVSAKLDVLTDKVVGRLLDLVANTGRDWFDCRPVGRALRSRPVPPRQWFVVAQARDLPAGFASQPSSF